MHTHAYTQNYSDTHTYTHNYIGRHANTLTHKDIFTLTKKLTHELKRIDTYLSYSY